jgi:Cu+-exporting ATPase
VEDERGAGLDRERERREQEGSELRRTLLISAALTVPLMLLGMAPMVLPQMHAWLGPLMHGMPWRLLSFALATAVQFGPGRRFYRTGWRALRHGSPDMNTLVMIGTSAAYGYSGVAAFLPALLPTGSAQLYFESSATIITLVLLGRYLEAIARGRTGEAIRRLVGLQPRTVHVVRAGEERDVQVETVAAGEMVVIRPGERIPLDAVVRDGASYVDESMITGEPVPVHKEAGAMVIGGTVNGAGALVAEVVRTGAETVLARIIGMVEEAQRSKPRIQALVDRIAAVFVPVVLALAAITFLLWSVWGPHPALGLALANAVAVLIVACPCAMGLATPTSIMVGTGRGAELGLFFRRGDALQMLRDARVIVLDKTGTLTGGKPELTDLIPTGTFDRMEILRLAASVESRSEHPIARAVVDAAGNAGIPLEDVRDFRAVPGFGVTGVVDGRRVAVGAGRLMLSLGLDPGPFLEPATGLARQGSSPLYAAVDDAIVAILAVADPIRETTPEAIAALHRLGLRVAMVTGDDARTAHAIARRLGIDEVLADVLPEGKAEAVRRLRSDAGRVAFVGDGINDAPALARADVGIAIGTGTDVAIEAADVVLISGDLRAIVDAIALSKATLRNIAQNLFWAFAYNIVLIPLAAGALYPSTGILLSPMIAAASMGASSIFVLGNALRLKRFARR